MRLNYKAFDKTGRAVTDSIEAVDASDASEQLRRQGLYVTQFSSEPDTDDLSPANVKAIRSGGGRNRMRNLAVFTRQLYVLSSTGTPLVDSLGALERQASDAAWRPIIGDLRQRVEQGTALSEAMGAHPRCFDKIYCSLVAAGESGGKFDEILDRLSHLVRKQMQTRNTVMGSLLYPALLLVVSVAVLILMFTFVLPRFSGLFTTLKVPLPPTTKAMMFISDILRGYWWALILGAGAVITVLWLYFRTRQGKELLENAVVRLPLVGPITRNFITARIVRLIGVLMESYVPLLDVLVLAKEAAGNVCYRKLMANASEAVTRGDVVSSAFDDDKLITPSVYEAIRSGEQTGRLSEMLLNMADFMDEENEVVLRSLTSIIEPVILIGLGLVVGMVAVSMFMPLFDLTSMTGAS